MPLAISDLTDGCLTLRGQLGVIRRARRRELAAQMRGQAPRELVDEVACWQLAQTWIAQAQVLLVGATIACESAASTVRSDDGFSRWIALAVGVTYLALATVGVPHVLAGSRYLERHHGHRTSAPAAPHVD